MVKNRYWYADSKGFTVTLPKDIVALKPAQFETVSAWIRDIIKNNRVEIIREKEKLIHGWTEKDRKVIQFWHARFTEMMMTPDGKKMIGELAKKYPQLATMATEWDTIIREMEGK